MYHLDLNSGLPYIPEGDPKQEGYPLISAVEYAKVVAGKEGRTISGQIVTAADAPFVILAENEGGHVVERGGKGSGHHGHAGRPGKVGGSLPAGESYKRFDQLDIDGMEAFINAVEFVNGYPLKSTWEKTMPEWADGVEDWRLYTDEQRNYPEDLVRAMRAIRGYVGADYMRINGYLRGEIYLEESSAIAADRVIAYLDAFIEENRTPEDVIAYRGIKSKKIADMIENSPESLIGSTFTDAGFASTTILSYRADHFAGFNSGVKEIKESGVLVEIQLPAGSRAGGVMREYELILPRDTEFRVLDVDTRIYDDGIFPPHKRHYMIVEPIQ